MPEAAGATDVDAGVRYRMWCTVLVVTEVATFVEASYNYCWSTSISVLLCRGNVEIEAAKQYWDVKIIQCESGKVNLGVCTKAMNVGNYVGFNEHSWSIYGSPPVLP